MADNKQGASGVGPGTCCMSPSTDDGADDTECTLSSFAGNMKLGRVAGTLNGTALLQWDLEKHDYWASRCTWSPARSGRFCTRVL